jgi:hypothetical protein
VAKYQREFLIPYLNDITVLHLALHKLESRLERLEHQKSALERGMRLSMQPQEPRYPLANGGFMIGMGAFLLINALWMFVMKLPVVGLFGAIGGLMGIIAGSVLYVRTARDTARHDRNYNHRLMEYRRLEIKNRQDREAIPGIEAETAVCQAQISRVKDALEAAHSANIIPQQFRNVSAVMFLHSWFGQGTSNDLDAALNTYSLVESGISLEQMIANEGQELLNAYLHPQDQPQPPDSDSPALRQSRSAATGYFATADYLAKL